MKYWLISCVIIASISAFSSGSAARLIEPNADTQSKESDEPSRQAQSAGRLEGKELLSQDKLVYVTTDAGLVVIELAPFMAPVHVEQFKNLVKEGFYNGLRFYRVIDGFVAQAGDLSEKKVSRNRHVLSAEFSRRHLPESSFESVQSPEFLAKETGFIQGFPAGRNLDDKQEWLLHCPGAVGMARNADANSATSDFYIVIGQAPRHLDRNMSVFGQVVYGLENVQKMERGEVAEGGGMSDANRGSTIIKAELGSDVAPSIQLRLVRDKVGSENFQNRLNNARTLSNEFYHYKGTGNVDVCYYQPRVSLDSSNP